MCFSLKITRRNRKNVITELYHLFGAFTSRDLLYIAKIVDIQKKRKKLNAQAVFLVKISGTLKLKGVDLVNKSYYNKECKHR